MMLNRIKKRLERANIKMQILRNRFWFVDIPRTSSSSIKVELAKRYGVIYGKSNLIERKYSTKLCMPDHIPSIKMKEFLGPVLWNTVFVFTFVRNPWDRMVSHYFYRKKIGQIPSDMRFRDYVLELNESIGSGRFRKHYHYYGLSNYILGDRGEVICDFIGRYENRDRDIREIAKTIGFEELGNLRIQKASPTDKHYSEYYDEESRDIIRSLYKTDIELFDYDFELKPRLP